LQDCGVSAFLEILVLIERSGIFSNFGAENPQPRKALGRYGQVYETTTKQTTADTRASKWYWNLLSNI
jgi:hypothetical protein